MMMTEKPKTVGIKVGREYEFVSEIEGADANGVKLRNYTGQRARVLRLCGPDENDPDNSPLYAVRFPDGYEGQAWQEELNGWDKAHGQFYGPKGVWGDPD